MKYKDTNGTLQSYYNARIQEQNKDISIDTELLKKHAMLWHITKKTKKEITKNISVIMLLYKPASKKWLFESLYSTLWQITPNYNLNIEIIVILDPPIHPYIEWLQDFMENKFDFKLKIYTSDTRLGYAGSYNKALDKCTGDYIFVQDYDDISHPERFTTQIDILDNRKELMGVSCCPVNFSKEDYSDAYVGTGRPAILESPIHTLLDATLFRYSDDRPMLRINPQTLCFRKDIAKNIRIKNKYVKIDRQIPQMDRLFLLHILNKYPVSIMQIPKGHLFFRMHGAQTCKNKYINMSKEGKKNLESQAHIEMSEEIIKNLQNKTILSMLLEEQNLILRKANE